MRTFSRSTEATSGLWIRLDAPSLGWVRCGMLEFSHISENRASPRLPKISGGLLATCTIAPSRRFEKLVALVPSGWGSPERLTPAPERTKRVRHPIEGRIFAPVMSRAAKAPAAAAIRQVIQTGRVNFITSAQFPLDQTLSELTSATR
jgi:hypothetical protein